MSRADLVKQARALGLQPSDRATATDIACMIDLANAIKAFDERLTKLEETAPKVKRHVKGRPREGSRAAIVLEWLEKHPDLRVRPCEVAQVIEMDVKNISDSMWRLANVHTVNVTSYGFGVYAYHPSAEKTDEV